MQPVSIIMLGTLDTVVVNFMGQLYWTSRCQILDKTFFWEFLGACFWMLLTFKSVDCVKQMTLPNVGGPHPVSGRPA